jgi:hypothetical protein
MRRLVLILALCTTAALTLSALPGLQKGVQSERVLRLELFGIPLKSATRDQLRQAFKLNGMHALREDKTHWIDSYDARGVLDGSSEFIAGYVDATDKFAFAVYTFSGNKDTKLVGKVIHMVSMKYGHPSSKSGDYDHGPVRAEWDLGQGMAIMVCRGWPDTTTSLIYRDASAFKEMIAEMETAENAQERRRPKSQENAL